METASGTAANAMLNGTKHALIVILYVLRILTIGTAIGNEAVSRPRG